MIQEQCAPWMPVTHPSAIAHILGRLGISYKRGRDYVHSPDPHYQEKRDYIRDLTAEAMASAGKYVILFEDELTYYRQPTVARAYEQRGHSQALARRSHRANTPTRVAAVLNSLTGQVNYWQGAKFGLREMVRFYKAVRAAYEEAERIWIILDNWPVHFHPDVLVALQPQVSPWPYYLPGNWPKEPSAAAVKAWGELQLPIQLVALPTYASWTNPTEKVWRKGKQERLHQHEFANDLPGLRQSFAEFLDQFAEGSLELLRYVGLMTPGLQAYLGLLTPD